MNSEKRNLTNKTISNAKFESESPKPGGSGDQIYENTDTAINCKVEHVDEEVPFNPYKFCAFIRDKNKCDNQVK